MAARYWSGIHKVANAANDPSQRSADGATEAHMRDALADPKIEAEATAAIPDGIAERDAGILRRDAAERASRP